MVIFVQLTTPAGWARQFEGMKTSCTPGGLDMFHGYTPKQLKFGTSGPAVPQNIYFEAQMRTDFAGWDFLESKSNARKVQDGLTFQYIRPVGFCRPQTGLAQTGMTAARASVFRQRDELQNHSHSKLKVF